MEVLCVPESRSFKLDMLKEYFFISRIMANSAFCLLDTFSKDIHDKFFV